MIDVYRDQVYTQVFPTFILNVGMFCGILSVPLIIVMDMNNVMHVGWMRDTLAYDTSFSSYINKLAYPFEEFVTSCLARFHYYCANLQY